VRRWRVLREANTNAIPAPAAATGALRQLLAQPSQPFVLLLLGARSLRVRGRLPALLHACVPPCLYACEPKCVFTRVTAAQGGTRGLRVRESKDEVSWGGSQTSRTRVTVSRAGARQ
jgi:hypothetical protein